MCPGSIYITTPLKDASEGDIAASSSPVIGRYLNKRYRIYTAEA